VIAETLVQ